MSLQFVSVQGLVDTLYNASGKVESWDIGQYDKVNAPTAKRKHWNKQTKFHRTGRQHDMRDARDNSELPGKPGTQERINALAEFYANMQWAGDAAQSPFNDPKNVPDDVYDISPAKLGFFNVGNNADSSGDDLGDHVE